MTYYPVEQSECVALGVDAVEKVGGLDGVRVVLHTLMDGLAGDGCGGIRWVPGELWGGLSEGKEQWVVAVMDDDARERPRRRRLRCWTLGACRRA